MDRPLPAESHLHPSTSSPDGAADALARACAEPGHGPAALAAAALEALPAAARAWLLTWDAASGGLELVADADRARGPGERHAVASVRLAPARLDEPARAAWSGAAAVGMARSFELPWSGAAWSGAVALERAGVRWALVVLAGDAAPPSPAGLSAFARGAERAVALGEVLEERARRARQGAALAECARAASEAAHLSEVFHRAVRAAALATGAEVCMVWQADAEGRPRLEVTHGPAGRRERLAQGLTPLAADVIARARPEVIDRALDDARLSPETAAALRAVTALPFGSRGAMAGALVLVDPPARRPGGVPAFDLADLEFATALAGLLALSVEQAARHTERRRDEQRHRELRARLAREEQFASLGEAALRMAAEARNPLASIGAFARRVLRALPEDDVQRESLEIVLREAARLERLMADTLAEAPGELPRLAVESVNRAVQDALAAAGETLVRRRVRLLKRLAPDLPALLVDPEKVRRVVSNLLACALDAVPVGGRVRVESRRAGGYVQVEIAHDGPRAPGDLMEQLFQSFAGGETGAGSGLAVAERVIREHGGEIRVRGEGDWSNVVSFTLPVADNQDRRHSGSERRGGRGERRRAAGG